MKSSALFLLLLIFAAGCIGQQQVNVNNGLFVHEFTADPAQIEPDDAVRFFLDVENVGGTTARGVTAELFGVDSWRDEFGVPFTMLYPGLIVPTRGLFFSYANGNFNVCYSDNTNIRTGGAVGNVCVSRVRGQGIGLSGFIGQAFLDFANQFCNSYINGATPKLVKFQCELLPPVPSLGRAGQSATFEWIMRPPVLPEGASAIYPVTARTSFFYTTNSVMNIQAYNKAEFKRRTDLGQPTESPLVIENSFGSPIQVFVTRGSSPIVVNTDQTAVTGNPIQLESYRFEFANLGEGFPLPMSGVDAPSVPSPTTQSGFVSAVMKISGPGVAFHDCLGQSGNEIFVSPATIAWIKLRSDQRVPIGCTIAIARQQWASTPVGTITFEFNLNYRYYIDRTVNVKVLGISR